MPRKKDWGDERRAVDRREDQGASGRRLQPERRRRPDESLAQEIREILTTDPELDATGVEVEVEGGAVTIAGEVADPDARLLAEELVESVAGVREVHNRLRVAR
jgi:osmotically-inducible protein OsmY